MPVTMIRANANSFAYVKMFCTFIDILTLIVFTAVSSTETAIDHAEPLTNADDNSQLSTMTANASLATVYHM